MALKHANVSCIAWSETGPVKDGWAAASPMAVIQVMASTADCAVFRVRTGVKDDTVMIFRAQWSMTEFFSSVSLCTDLVKRLQSSSPKPPARQSGN
jgi:hypothetical protein